MEAPFSTISPLHLDDYIEIKEKATSDPFRHLPFPPSLYFFIFALFHSDSGDSSTYVPSYLVLVFVAKWHQCKASSDSLCRATLNARQRIPTRIRTPFGHFVSGTNSTCSSRYADQYSSTTQSPGRQRLLRIMPSYLLNLPTSLHLPLYL